MAIYHLSVKTISRSAGRSATAAAAYRARGEITDERTGEIHDYTRKGGVRSAALILPDNAPSGHATAPNSGTPPSRLKSAKTPR